MCEEEIKKVTASVFKYILPKSWSKERKEKDPITAERVVEAIKAGKDLEIKNAVITGPFILKSVNVEGEITIKNTKIRGPIDWSYATFKRVLNLEDSIFETDATFTAVTVEKDIFLDNATFLGEAKFSNLSVMGAFYSPSTTFKKDVIFSEGIVKKSITFSKSTFGGEADFGNARIGGTAKFTGVNFKKQASFNGAQIEESAFFYSADLFSIDVEDVEFEDDLNKGIIPEKLKNIFKTEDYSLSEKAMVTNGQDDKWRITDMYYLFSWENFPRGDIDRLLRFLVDDLDIRWATDAKILIFDFYKTIRIFNDENSVEIKIDAKKEKATLKISDCRTHDLKVKEENGKLNIYTDIEKIYIVKKEEGKLNISNPATFWGEVDFTGARIGSDAEFMEAEFKKKASFNSAKIDGVAFFNSATFVGDADFISARIGSNAEFTRAEFRKKASFNRAQIEESAFFNSATFVGDADFISARIGSNAWFTVAEFKKEASFNQAQIEESAFFNPATFGGEANFESARIGGTADFTGVKFKKNARFNGAQIERDALFNPACLFSIDVEFKDDLNKGIIPEKLKNIFEKELKNIFKTEDYSLSKKAMVTNGQDDKWRITDIEEIYIVKKEKGKLNIYNPTTFVYEANFVSARIGGTAEFTGVKFKKKASFNRARIKESAFFDPATFEGEANFIGARIGSIAVFTGATFKQQASFSRTQIVGAALFNPATFEGEANFRSARIGSNANFTGATFKKQAIFNSAQIERESHFEGTVFVNDVHFQDTTLKTVFWGEPNVKFIKNIDLRGCIYDRFQPIPFWKQLMKPLSPYDRQPFTQLEETFRRAGKDKLADDVYYERRCREYTENIAIRMYLFSWDCVPGDDDEKLKKFLKDDLDIGWTENAEIRKSNDGKTLSISKDEKRYEIILDAIKKKATLKISDDRTFYLNVKKKHGKLNIYRTWDAWLHSALRKLSALLLDRFLFRFTGYGVRLYRLLWTIVPILLIGTIIFHLEGAVKLDIQLPCMMSSQVTLPWWEAFWVSLNTFLPIEIPSGADWKPSSQIIPMFGIKFTTFATFLDLAGWILVPVGVAGIAGLLKRPK